MLGACGFLVAGRVNGESGNSTGSYFNFIFVLHERFLTFSSVDVLQRQVISLTEQVRTMSQSYEEFIEGKDQRTTMTDKSTVFIRLSRPNLTFCPLNPDKRASRTESKWIDILAV